MLESLKVFTAENQKNRKVIFQLNPFLYSSKKALQLIAMLNQVSKNNENRTHVWTKLDELIYSDDFEKVYVETGKDFKTLITLQRSYEQMKTDVESSNNEDWTKIVLGGEFSSGKSSFLNSILFSESNTEFLPVSEKPTSLIPTYIYCSENHSSQAIFAENSFNSKIDLSVNALLALGHDFQRIHDVNLNSFLNKLIIEQPVLNGYLNDIVFVDTPGYSKEDGDFQFDKQKAIEEIQQGEVLFWIVDIEFGSLKKKDLEFIKNYFNKDKPKVIIFNKADKKTTKDIQSIIDYAAKVLRANRDENVIDILAYSSHDGRIVDSFKGYNTWEEILIKVKKQSKKIKAEHTFTNSLELILKEVKRDIRRKIETNRKDIKRAKGSTSNLKNSSRYDYSYIKEEIRYYFNTACSLNVMCYDLHNIGASALNREIEWLEKAGMFKKTDHLLDKREQDMMRFSELSNSLLDRVEPISKNIFKDINTLEQYVNSAEIDSTLEFNRGFIDECKKDIVFLEEVQLRFTNIYSQINSLLHKILSQCNKEQKCLESLPLMNSKDMGIDIFQVIVDDDYELFIDWCSTPRDLTQVINEHGDNILLCAVKNKRYRMIEILLPKATSLINQCNISQECVLSIARELKDHRILTLLKS